MQQASGLLGRVEAEIQDLHRFFEQWLSGALPADRDIFDAELADRLDPGFIYIQPAGVSLGGEHLVQAILDGHGASPDFAIKIRNVAIRRLFDNDNVVLATYEEYQRGARNSAHAENARVSTALMLDRGNGARFRWIHIQETWLTAEHHAAHNFEF